MVPRLGGGIILRRFSVLIISYRENFRIGPFVRVEQAFSAERPMTGQVLSYYTKELP
jgi:hypothetical protein